MERGHPAHQCQVHARHSVSAELNPDQQEVAGVGTQRTWVLVATQCPVGRTAREEEATPGVGMKSHYHLDEMNSWQHEHATSPVPG